MPPIDELPVNAGNIDPNLHVFLTNKKNIHINLPLDQLSLNNVAEILAACSLDSHDIAIFATREGKNMYTLQYR